MSDTPTRPAWVEALDKAQVVLRSATKQDTPEGTDSKIRLAYGWMDVAKLLKG